MTLSRRLFILPAGSILPIKEPEHEIYIEKE